MNTTTHLVTAAQIGDTQALARLLAVCRTDARRYAQRHCQVSDDALRIDLAKALESLPAHYLEVVLLRDFEELTIAEIAQRLEEPAGAIKSRLHRARELVREYLLA